MYVTVKERSESKLHLSRGPSFQSLALFGGLVVLVFGAAISGFENIFWKLTYVTAAIVIGLSYIEEFEDCIFDKEKGEVCFIQESFFRRYVLSHWRDTPRVVASAAEIEDVFVEGDTLGHSNHSAFHVVIQFTNYSIGVTQMATFGDSAEHVKTAELIREFLGMDPTDTKIIPPPSQQQQQQQQSDQQPVVGEDEVIHPDDLSTEDEEEEESQESDSFEKVEKTDLADTPVDTPPGFDDESQIPVVDGTRD